MALFMHVFILFTISNEIFHIKSKRVEHDDMAKLFCEVDSKPKVHEVRLVRDGRFVQTNFRHLIPRANLKDAGSYICSTDIGLG